MANYVHPSISSTITDNSVTYVTASGTTKLFAVFTSAKGEDNVIKMMTSVSEYEFHYGEPNMKKYGQVGYNVINWLNSGGIVYCLRVLPEDAGYANAIVNIQSKVSSKEVLDVNGNIVEVPNVFLRPTITYTNVNNVSETSIEFDELRKPITNTIDGYQNNMLFAVIPKGRGQGYNDLGFRIALVDSYDATYEFRLYSFEVTKVSASGSTSTVQGPFLVSLDPDALSISGESLFIKTVVDKHCDYFSIIFNEDNYEKLGATINPNVHPNRIDFFNGQTRVVENGAETYYDATTGKDEDVHMYVTKYNIYHQPTSERNIVDTTNTIEAAIVGTDNTYRAAVYQRYVEALDRMKIALSKIKKVTPTSNPLQVLLASDITAVQNDTTIPALFTSLTEKVTALNGTTTNANYLEANTVVTSLSTAIKNRLADLYELFDYSRVNGDTAESIAVTTYLKEIEGILYILQNYSIKYSSLTTSVNALALKVSEALNNKVLDSEKESLLAEVITSVSDIIDILEASQSTAETFADSTIATAKTALSNIALFYDDLTAPYTIPEDYEVSMTSAFNALDGLFTTLKFAIQLTLLEVQVHNVKSIQISVDNATSQTLSLIDAVIAKAGTSAYNVADINASIALFETSVTAAKQSIYKTVLQNFDTNIKLLFGSDGSITDVLPSSTEVEKLIIKGYLGTVDDRLLDKKLFPIDLVLDANYSVNVKNALVQLATEIRGDFMGILDTKFQATPEAAIAFRKNSLSVSNFKTAIFAQDFVVSDTAYTGQNIQVTAPYFLASKIPTNDNANGIHWNFVGPRRGTISGFESISFIPNPEWKEQLYKAQVNYVEQDSNSTRFGSQLTSQAVVSALSNINNVRTILRIQRDVEVLMGDYQFEYNDNATRSSAQLALNAYLTKWVSNRACDSISGTVYASDYDRLEKLLRVKIEIIFNSIIERIAIDLIVNN